MVLRFFKIHHRRLKTEVQKKGVHTINNPSIILQYFFEIFINFRINFNDPLLNAITISSFNTHNIQYHNKNYQIIYSITIKLFSILIIIIL